MEHQILMKNENYLFILREKFLGSIFKQIRRLIIINYNYI